MTLNKELEAIVAFREYCEKQAAPFDVIATLEACRDEGVSVEIDPQKLIDLLISTQAGEAWRDIATAPKDGMVLVPRVATPKMIDATWDEDLDAVQHESHNSRNRRIWDAMIAAAIPSPPSDTKGESGG